MVLVTWNAKAAILSAVAAGLLRVLVEPELSTSDPPRTQGREEDSKKECIAHLHNRCCYVK